MANKRAFSNSFAQRDDFQIAILCALSLESDIVEKLFDEVYETRSLLWQKSNGDSNCYTTGKIGNHHVVLAYMPGVGKINATITASSIRATFKNIRLALVVGICGGAPETPDQQNIYHGDVVISTKILQTDFGREFMNKFVMKGPDEGNLGPAGKEVQSFLSKLRTPSVSVRIREKTKKNTQILIADSGCLVPQANEDVLFRSDHVHKHHAEAYVQSCDVCLTDNLAVCNIASTLTCLELGCSVNGKIRDRTRAVMDGPEVFFGAISSTDTVRKSGLSRDQFVHQYNVLAFEMEGAGVWETLPTIVIKAVSDYADSHKSKEWQAYAATTAAATCAAILDEWQTSETGSELRSINVWSTNDTTRRLAKQYLDSLDFPQLDSRSASIEPAYPLTCDWVFRTPQFLSWKRWTERGKHNQILWLKGKPGAGKSTLIRYVHQSAQRFFPQHTVAAFYFHARGEELQSSRLGMLRAILHQLLVASPSLLQRFMNIFPLRRGINIEHRLWTYEELQNFLLLSAQQGWLDRALILVDALDECPESEARELVAFCESLAMNAIAHYKFIYICLSSRHYPSICLSKGLQLNMDTEQRHKIAIQHYVTQRLRIYNSSIITGLLKRANGVFLWAKLVTSMLNTALDRGNDFEEIKIQLDKIPIELHSIYERMFRSQDNATQTKTILLLQLIMYAKRPLRPRALYLLMIAGISPSKLCSWDECGMTDSTVASYIFTVSHGLAEIIESDDGPFVQFIHETVRGFLLGYRGDRGEHDTTFSYRNCHTAIARCCIASMSAPRYPSNFLAIRKFPHLKYALRYVLGHLDEFLDPEQPDMLLKQYCEHAAKYLWFYLRGRQKDLSGSFVLRAILMSSHCQHEKILTVILKNIETMLPPDQHAHTDCYGHALVAAAEQGLERCLCILLDAGADCYATGCDEIVLETVMRVLSVEDPARPNRERQTQIVLEIDELSSDITIHGLDESSSQSVSSLPQLGKSWLSTDIFEFLFDKYLEATLPSQPLYLSLLLVMAVRASSPSCFRKILEAGANANTIIGSEPVLLYILRTKFFLDSDRSMTLQQAMIATLLDYHADPNLPDALGYPAIFYAISLRSLPLMELLLRHGATPYYIVRGTSLLHLAAFVGFTDCFKSLLVRGLHINRRDQSGCIPLLMSIRRYSQIKPNYTVSWWTPASPPVLSPSNLTERLMQSIIRLMELGASSELPYSIAMSNLSGPVLALWHENFEAVKRLLERKARTRVNDAVSRCYGTISAEAMISLLLGVPNPVYVGMIQNNEQMKNSLRHLSCHGNSIEQKAAVRVLDMIQGTNWVEDTSSTQMIVNTFDRFKDDQQRDIKSQHNTTELTVRTYEPRAIQVQDPRIMKSYNPYVRNIEGWDRVTGHEELIPSGPSQLKKTGESLLEAWASRDNR